MNLKYSEVYRGGITSPYITLETKNISLTTLGRDVRFAFSIASKGGGTTRVRVDINKRDFQAVIRHMLEVDRPAAMKAIADEFAREIAREPEVVAEAERKGREQVKELAGEKYIAAPIGRDENEKAVYDATQELVKELEGKTSKTA